MKPANFPARRLERQFTATYGIFWVVEKPELKLQVEAARLIRTKKARSIK